jgi:hypothetical protein
VNPKKKKLGQLAAGTCRLPILNSTNPAGVARPKIQQKPWKTFKANCRKRGTTPEAGVRILLLERMGLSADPGMPHPRQRSDLSVRLAFARDDDLAIIDIMMQEARELRRLRTDQVGATAAKIERAFA